MKAIILSGDYIEDYELFAPIKLPEMLDIDRTHSENIGHPFELSQMYADIKLDEYAGLVVPGGRYPKYQRYDQRVLDIILAAAGVLKGRSCSTVHISKLEVLAGGGTYVDFDMLSKNVYVDGNLVSAPAYPVIGVWMREFIKLLGVKVQFSS
ncbi:hypothetical protein IW147_003840 [Coemansia sp. RSA 720]|nr:hypothetical protein IW147_003840 [Coemansia sp. RSA 720]